LKVYADTSFLVSLYSPDMHSAQAAALMQRLAPVVLLTPVGEMELTNALELRVFRKDATGVAIRAAQAKIQQHVQAGFFSPQAMPLTVYARAENLARKRTSQLGVGTLDILHVACALLLRAERFLTFDERQRNLAQREGLKVGF
jgi:predicted nucleic acid-binding protein